MTQVISHDVGFGGWLTTDEQEIERRRLRGREESFTIASTEKGRPYYGQYLVRSEQGQAYHVELRHATECVNSCNCPDFKISGLGTCKHIEAVKHELGQKKQAPRTNTRTEIYLDTRCEPPSVRISWGRDRQLLTPLEALFTSDGRLIAPPCSGLPVLRTSVERLPLAAKKMLRVSRLLPEWLATLQRQADKQTAREQFLLDVAEGKRDLNPLSTPLYPYQEEGMLHLAFGERALLSDEMGLGKTVQALAAAELLHRLRGIERVLIVLPASLKTEWEEQIQQFTQHSVCVIHGSRSQRLHQYRQRAFYYLVNYEQVRSDTDAIQELLAPDLVILDEAQRVKNWQTKNAQAVRRLNSPYLFVLTGTPLENRIDDIYSIMQVIDPTILGPLFRFNRAFYQLDERGHPIGVKNLDLLHRKLRPFCLRRTKSEVEDQLPPRTINNYFVAMDAEQKAVYQGYQEQLGRFIQASEQRGLRKEERQQLQGTLACMRMVCDSPYILDQSNKVSPKLDELMEVLSEILDDSSAKVLIFSEWERMLELVRERLEQRGYGYAWHTGSVPQKQRGKVIKSFKDDPMCRVFLSTDSGSTGLNLQAAHIVINVDLPWNPAKLEQRIGRAWRKQQSKPVQVINFICADSIEQQLLGTLDRKQELASAVLDGGPTHELLLSKKRSGLVQQVSKLIDKPARVSTPIQEALPQALGDALLAIEIVEDQLLIVVKELNSEIRGRIDTLNQGGQKLHVITREAYQQVQQLIQAGFYVEKGIKSYENPALQAKDKQNKLQQRAQRLLCAVERKVRLAEVLAEGDFVDEAERPMHEAIELLEQAGRLLQLPPSSWTVKRSSNVADSLQQLKEKVAAWR